MTATLDEVKRYLRIDFDDDDADVLPLIMESAEEYVISAVGEKKSHTARGKMLFLVLCNDWYEHRELMETKEYSEKVRYTITSIIEQMQAEELTDEEEKDSL